MRTRSISKTSAKARRHSRAATSLQFELLEQRCLLAAETILINFQFDEAPVPNGYQRDVGALYGDRGNGLNYGWTSDHTDVSRDRGLLADQRLDTLIHFHQSQSWELAVPNGTYEVTAVVGDPAFDDGVHTLNVEGINFFNAVNDTSVPMSQTMQVTVADGRLTLDQGTAAEKATRINYIHVIGLPSGTNASPATPTITEPAVDGQEVNPSDVHMEAVGFSDTDGDTHKSSDWEIWTTGPGSERVWFTLGIEGVERLHTHLADGFFENSHAGRSDLLPNTDYELRARFRDSAGSVSGYDSRMFTTGSAFTIFPLDIEDIATTPTPTWEDINTQPIELPGFNEILSPGDAIIAIDTDSGESSYPPNESPQNAIDGTLNKYLNFGEQNSGFIVTPSKGASIIESFEITTANDAVERDPTTWSLYGTNDPITSADNSTGTTENWNLIDSGSLSLPSARNTTDSAELVAGSTAYSSYRMIFSAVKDGGAANSMQFAEIQFFGEVVGRSALLSAGNPIIAIDTDGDSAYPDGEEPQNAIDNSTSKYLNFGKVNSGFIVTPPSSGSTVTGFQITTANDFEGRDPTSWEIYGTDDPITSTDNSTGTAENWTLIASGSISLPSARNAVGPNVTFSNSSTFSSYRVLFTGLKDAGGVDSMQIGEFQLFGDLSMPSTAASLSVESAAGDTLLLIEGSESGGNQITNPPALAEHVDVRVVVSGGQSGWNSLPSNLVFEAGNGQQHTIYLPEISLAGGESAVFWVALDGSTYFGTAGQSTPDFSNLARAASESVPFVPLLPNYVVEEVAGGFQLPVNIAFVPSPGAADDDPLFYVNELYGTIKVVTNDGTVSDFATGLLNFNPTGNFPGSGEQGLAGLVVDPISGDLFVTRVTDTDGLPGGAHHPQVLRLSSADGGRTMATSTVILDMPGENQGQSHQISNASIGPDGMLYIHNGDGFDASTALNLDSYRGKILRMDLNGNPLSDNPFYDATNGINSRDYVFAYGLRNPFGGAWRASDGRHYEVENGPSIDRFARVEEAGNYQWDGSNASMLANSIYTWNPAHAPVNISFVESQTFGGSGFPASMHDRAFVSESGPTYAQGPQTRGKRIVSFELDAAGNVVGGPQTLVEYVGVGRATVVGLAAGPDGIYFTDLYKDLDAQTPIDAGARVLRVRYVGGISGDFDLDGDVDGDDLIRWQTGYGTISGADIADGDADEDQDVDGTDFLVWQHNHSAMAAVNAQNLHDHAATTHKPDALHATGSVDQSFAELPAVIGLTTNTAFLGEKPATANTPEKTSRLDSNVDAGMFERAPLYDFIFEHANELSKEYGRASNNEVDSRSVRRSAEAASFAAFDFDGSVLFEIDWPAL